MNPPSNDPSGQARRDLFRSVIDRMTTVQLLELHKILFRTPEKFPDELAVLDEVLSDFQTRKPS